MSHPVVHAEIRSSDPDATRAFFGELFGWTYPSEGAFPGYTFVDTGGAGRAVHRDQPSPGGWRPGHLLRRRRRHGGEHRRHEDRLGGRVVQEPVDVPGVRFALIADPQGHVVGLAQQL